MSLLNRVSWLGMSVLAFPLLLSAQKREKPNLVFIMADQWRGQALGYLGLEPVITPHLDRLAAEGVSFENAVSGYPVSSPARGMLMTGQYPINSRLWGNCNSETAPYGVELAQTARCWSDVLKDQGYALGYIGKWHLDAPYRPYVDTYNNRGKVAWNEWCPKERRHGFEYWIAYGTYDNHLKPMYWSTEAGREDFYYVDRWGPEYEADRAIDYIRGSDKVRLRNKPFALVVSMNPPHTGYELVPEKYKSLYRDVDVETLCRQPDIPPKGTDDGDYYRHSVRDYYACMTGVDEQVGRIIEALKQGGLWENTIFVFTSDHGVCMGRHNEKGKDIYYEESMRIPLLISWPGEIKARRDSSTRIAFADLYPSLLSLMGLEKQIPGEVETFDLSRRIRSGKGKQPEFQPYYWIDVAHHGRNGRRGIRTDRYTFVWEIQMGKIVNRLLFDRENDPYELKNIAEQEAVLVRKYEGKMQKWLEKTSDPLWKAFR